MMGMTKELKHELQNLKKMNFKNCSVSLWLVFRRLNNKIATYEVKAIKIDESLTMKLAGVVEKKVSASNEILEYDYFSIDPDGKLLVINSDETDFELILEQVNEGSDADFVKTTEDLKKTWGYIIKLQDSRSIILGYKQIEEKWDVEKRPKINMLFKEQKFFDLKEDSVFKIEKDLDYIYFNDRIFVINKAKFELSLNFRKGMTIRKENLLNELKSMKILTDVDKINSLVGENLHYLRQLATIEKNGYFRNPGFINNLTKVNKAEKWGLTIKNGQIEVNDDNVELILKVLNKDRLKDLIEGETFDVNIKTIVSLK